MSPENQARKARFDKSQYFNETVSADRAIN
jgi:hypothetical protein